MTWLFAVLSLLIYWPLAEYCVHRWIMHTPLLGKMYWWRDHAIEHHRKSRTDINIEASALNVLFVASPLLLFALLLGWLWVVVVMSVAIGYAALWSTLHAAHHGISATWLRRFAVYRTWERHHKGHHQHPARNFGTVFIFTDRCFGSRL